MADQREEDAYYDAYDADITAGRVKPVCTVFRADPGALISDAELDKIFQGPRSS